MIRETDVSHTDLNTTGATTPRTPSYTLQWESKQTHSYKMQQTYHHPEKQDDWKAKAMQTT